MFIIMQHLTRNRFYSSSYIFLGILLALFLPTEQPEAKEIVKLLNVSYDPTREFFDDYNQAFAKYWKEKSGQEIEIYQSHGGSGKQARAVIEGLKADIVTLALAGDINAIAEKSGLIYSDWQKKLPNNSCPYTSTIVFLVRKGNPKNINDWDDLIKEGVSVITPNPQTSGGARWNYLAAYGYALKKYNNDENASREFIAKLFGNVPILDTGARGAATTFVRRNIGDVLVSWENEAMLTLQKMGKDNFEIVYPSISIKAEPPVAVIDKVVDKKGTRKVAEEYLKYLYSQEGQYIASIHYFRPAIAFGELETRCLECTNFPEIEMISIDELGGWKEVQIKHFNKNGIFDQIYYNNMLKK